LQKVRAPFAGILTALHVMVGDHVAGGQVIATIVSQPSQAALIGAQMMLNTAKTPSDSGDARRALALARQNLIETALNAPRPGIVVSRGASQGDLMSQGDSIATIATAGSIAFIARIVQTDLAQVRPGQRASVVLLGAPDPVDAVVHGLLPADSAGTMTVPVRLDLRTSHGAAMPIPSGLFGTARITVGQRRQVTTVPMSAVLRDDVSGVSRVAVVAPNRQAHWVVVTTGAVQGDTVEITSPALSPGTLVIIAGQVGLPEGSGVRDIGSGVDTAAGLRPVAPAPQVAAPVPSTPTPVHP
jgi:RND family efflux transporter MFP subunit